MVIYNNNILWDEGWLKPEQIGETKMDLHNYLNWYHSLPTINKIVGGCDKYGQGTVRHIDFYGECTVVWVEYQTITKAYSYK